ncbi:MAG: glutamate synthase central domain-containing protein, partial [Oscillospiraceae bacterium]|nr:glutamate synthase central domain-containing protein [Oscillospiraceae bacterium]
MKVSTVPQRQGLYNPLYEHDACGIGFLANIKGKKSNEILRQSLAALKNLSHRGGVGSEPDSGDGAGVLLQIPHKFLSKVCSGGGIPLPPAGDYGTGIVFLPHGAALRAKLEDAFKKFAEAEGQKLLGWRDIPLNPSILGKTSRSSMPYMRQIFIERRGVDAGAAFDRKLYLIRRQVENAAQAMDSEGMFYVASLSSKIIVYKGMLTAEQLDVFYTDLGDSDMETALALIHSRYSTNTFPSWGRAHPNRYIIHNGEINTLRGNVNFMHARESMLESETFGDDLKKLLPIINSEGSDSAMFDNCVEFLMLSGMPIERVMMLMVPEPWSGHESMSDEKKAFYEFNSCRMEPWDGPAAMGFTDGVRIGAVLDRNGLRPARYCVTTDDMVLLASEVGALDIPQEKIIKKERLHPGRMLLIDTENGRIISDEEIKSKAAAAHPYRAWLNQYMKNLEDLPAAPAKPSVGDLPKIQKAFGYTYEDLRMTLARMVAEGVDPVASMGNDTPLAVLSKRPQLLYDYFKQLFAQVTNPPIDALREEIVTSSIVLLGSEGNLIRPTKEICRRIKLKTPIIRNEDLAKLQKLHGPDFKSVTLPILYKVSGGGKALEEALEELYRAATK